VTPRRAQLISELLDLVARLCHSVLPQGLASAILVCIERRWYAGRARSAAASMLELERGARHVRLLLEIPS
jgi:hypothetical protein